MTDALRESYDEEPYPGRAYEHTHPDRLATVATLYGLTPPPLERARVLDIGCSDGGNLLPMAIALPEATFLGVDLSPRQIESGRRILEETGVSNVELRSLSLTEIDASFGTFDYIVCHGVYSWVPPEVQGHVLRIFRENLAPNGLAYLSYNTYPGWHFRALVREMMLFRVRRVPFAQRAAAARSLLDILLAAVPDSSPFGLVLREEDLNLRDQSDTYLLHEHLEAENHPLYFHQLLGRLEAAGLRYVADAQLDAAEERLPADVASRLGELSDDPEELEQYLDFVRNRTFRRSVLARRECRPLPGPSPEGLRRLRVEATLRRPPDRSRLADDSEVTFEGRSPVSLTTNDPTIKIALDVAASAAPEPLTFAELAAETSARLGRAVNEDKLAAGILSSYRAHMVILHSFRPPFVTRPGERPMVSPVARYAARNAAQVPNLFHRLVELDALGLALVRNLDGTRTLSELVDALCQDVTEGRLEVTHEGKPVRDGRALEGTFVAGLPVALLRLAASALLVR